MRLFDRISGLSEATSPTAKATVNTEAVPKPLTQHRRSGFTSAKAEVDQVLKFIKDFWTFICSKPTILRLPALTPQERIFLQKFIKLASKLIFLARVQVLSSVSSSQCSSLTSHSQMLKYNRNFLFLLFYLMFSSFSYFFCFGFLLLALGSEDLVECKRLCADKIEQNWGKSWVPQFVWRRVHTKSLAKCSTQCLSENLVRGGTNLVPVESCSDVLH